MKKENFCLGVMKSTGTFLGGKMEKRFFLSGITTFFEWLDFSFLDWNNGITKLLKGENRITNTHYSTSLPEF